MRPIFLETYDATAELGKWIKSGPYDKRRRWFINPLIGNTSGVTCTLTWAYADGEAGIQKAALSIEEAVWEALGEFGMRGIE